MGKVFDGVEWGMGWWCCMKGVCESISYFWGGVGFNCYDKGSSSEGSMF